MKEAPGSPVIVPAQVLVEPMVFGQGKDPSEVPFAGMESRITFLPQVLRQGSFFQEERRKRPVLILCPWDSNACRATTG